MGQCTDFTNETTAMQNILREISAPTPKSPTISMLITPKYHCEIAGEGIEYNWGIAKIFYRNIPLVEKLTKPFFLNV